MLTETISIPGAILDKTLLDRLVAAFQEDLKALVEEDIRRIRAYASELAEEERHDAPGPSIYTSEELFTRASELEAQLQSGTHFRFDRGQITGFGGRTTEWGPDESGVAFEGDPPLERLAELEHAELRLIYDSWEDAPVTLDITYGFLTLTLRVTSGSHPLGSLCDALAATAEASVTDEARRQLQLTNRVFIGHGGDTKWKVLKDLLEREGYLVEAFESADRTGKSTYFEVLQMIQASRVAVIVMTAADELTSGEKVARQNVIHEIGLAHGLLGVENTLIVKEESCEEFSNIAGITQIRVPDGALHDAENELLAAVKSRVDQETQSALGRYPGRRCLS